MMEIAQTLKNGGNIPDKGFQDWLYDRHVIGPILESLINMYQGSKEKVQQRMDDPMGFKYQSLRDPELAYSAMDMVAPLAFHLATPSKFKQSLEKLLPEDQMMIAKPSLKELQKEIRRGGDLVVGTGPDLGAGYMLRKTGKGKPVELAAVHSRFKGKGAGQRAIRDATKRHVGRSTNELYLEAWDEIPGVSNLPEMYGKQGFKDDPAGGFRFELGQSPLGWPHGPVDIKRMVYEEALRKGGGPSIATPPWRPPESKIFDTSGLDRLDRFPPAEQIPIPRKMPAKGYNEKMTRLLEDEANKKRIQGLAEAGIPEGGLAWYNTRPLRDEHIAELGEALGIKEFDDFMEFVAALSPGSAVDLDTARATFIRMKVNQGYDPATLTFPEDMGHMYYKTSQLPIVKELMEGGGLSGGKPYSAPKVRSFGAGLKGNLVPYTGDTHARNITMGPYADIDLDTKGKRIRGSFKENEYKAAEEFANEISARMGIPPAQVQSATWAGASDITGVRDPRPYLQLLDKQIEEAASRLQISQKDALKKLIRKEIYLRPLEK